MYLSSEKVVIAGRVAVIETVKIGPIALPAHRFSHHQGRTSKSIYSLVFALENGHLVVAKSPSDGIMNISSDVSLGSLVVLVDYIQARDPFTIVRFCHEEHG